MTKARYGARSGVRRSCEVAVSAAVWMRTGMRCACTENARVLHECTSFLCSQMSCQLTSASDEAQCFTA